MKVLAIVAVYVCGINEVSDVQFHKKKGTLSCCTQASVTSAWPPFLINR